MSRRVRDRQRQRDRRERETAWSLRASDGVSFCSSPVVGSRASPAWLHVPMLVYFPGCTADLWKLCSPSSLKFRSERAAPPTCSAHTPGTSARLVAEPRDPHMGRCLEKVWKLLQSCPDLTSSCVYCHLTTGELNNTNKMYIFLRPPVLASTRACLKTIK